MQRVKQYTPSEPDLHRSIKILILSLVLGMISVLSVAQSSENLRGKVIEHATKQLLNGASVQVDNTQLGAITDIDGNFSLENVPTGYYSLTRSFIGFQTKNVTDIIISTNKTYYSKLELLDNVVQRSEGAVIAFSSTMLM